MEGAFWGNNGGAGYNDWDLDALFRLGGGVHAAIAPPYDDPYPFFALPPPQQVLPPLPQQILPPPPQQDVLPHANVWQQQAMDMMPMAHQADPALAGLEDYFTQGFFGAPQPSYPTNQVLPQQGAAANPPPAVYEPGSSSGGGSSRPKQTRRNKKNANNKVRKVPAAEVATADQYSWRKYGEKVIKGSLHPRSYYKCSTDKACQARRMVERSSVEPGLVILSYAEKHNHPEPRGRKTRGRTRQINREAPLPRAPALVVGGPAHAAPPPPLPRAPALVVSGPVHAAPPPPPVYAPSAAISFPPMPPPSLYPNEFEFEEEDDIALKFLMDDPSLDPPENAFLFPNPDGAPPAPVYGGGNMAMGAAGGGNDGQLFPFPLPEEVGTRSLDNSRGNVSGAGGAAAPVPNVVMDTFFASAWTSPAPGAAAGRWGM